MFAGFEKQQRQVNGLTISYRISGSGPALLLLHGHPQTHVIWHKVAEQLATEFTVVAADLRGYGDSDRPAADAEHLHYSKREMALDAAELMKSLGFAQFSVLAHDRGARVAHRLALDHPHAVKQMVLLDIAPTLTMYTQTDEAFARAYWHWFFPIRPAPLPESLIEANPELFSAQCDGQPQRWHAAVHGRGVCRVPALPAHPRQRAGHLRRLPRLGRHRSGTRSCRYCCG
ncbi:alpha/beta hydrolase [Pseudomonas syringae pv. syringae]|nr:MULTISPECIES: alpha/beta fold hydrolase [Pseudomonas]MCH5517097.1 alpha/beta hydrolase [Pseudomonas syringae pv. syringae]MCH5535972.1 alpha/beta hydrolase [Pseudomonas syringae pv. syringae]MCH5553239.1 alpha/beta hydrolase [Pseudomonas syringae pv. syringae]MCH5572064.1 alpha/beta hydrolase [Pseudomonas syringae pv. syringae]MCH5573248.1 alpha/beta hydrolase [Pseudomonas syringae pv. syringae]